jgi:zinc protease
MSKPFTPEVVHLSNGIPVILQNYEGPVAATYWWVKTGSADEIGPQAGFAHFLEHMLFKDTAAKETGKASTGQTARAIESLGGDINAYTSFDQTVYHVTCAAHHWEKVIDAFAPMSKPQKFLKQDFDREREVILEELAKNEDSPDRQLFQKMFSMTYKKHPYGRPVIGFRKTLKEGRVGALEKFYRSRYAAGNMGLILVGPIEDETGKRKKAILKQLEKYYGSKVFKKTPETKVARPDEPALRSKAEYAVLPFDVKTPKVAFCFRAPDLMHEDVPALDLLSSILGMGELSRLYQQLFYKTSLATEVSGGLYIPKDNGMLYFQAETDSLDKINTVAHEMLKELKRIAHEGPTDEELKRVIVNSESERLYATQSADGMAGRIGFLQFVLGDLNYDQGYLEALHLVDAARIKEVARTYFDPRRMSTVVLVPKENKDFDTSVIASAVESELGAFQAPALAKAKVHKKPGILPVDYIELPSGIRVVHHHRPNSQVFSIHSGVLGGLRLELSQPLESPQKDWGTSNMMSMTWAKGTKSKDARAIASIAEGSAAGFDGYAGRNTVGLQMTGLARDWGKLSSLLGESLFEATFPETEVEHSKRVTEDSIRSIEDHSAQLCSKQFLETLYENHPYGKMTIGSLDSVGAMHSEKLAAFHLNWVRPERLVLSVSGAVKRAALDGWLEEVEARSKKIQPAQHKPKDGPLESEHELKAPRWVEKNLAREQTHIIIGGLGTTITAEDRHALRIMQTILGGQSGRLFIELREKKSLGYTVAPISLEGLERGYVGTYIACAPAKKQEAIDGIKKVLETLATKGPSPAEMNRAKEFYLGRRAMDMQGDSSLAAHYGIEALYHIPHMSEEQMLKKVRGITAKDVQKVCAKYLIEPQMVTSIVG